MAVGLSQSCQVMDVGFSQLCFEDHIYAFVCLWLIEPSLKMSSQFDSSRLFKRCRWKIRTKRVEMMSRRLTQLSPTTSGSQSNVL
jgi:hypothetical protein